MDFVETPAGYRVPILHIKPQKGDEKWVMEYYNGEEHPRKLTFNGEKWV